MTFRTRLFVSSLAVAGATLLVATLLVSWSLRQSVRERIERSLVTEARLAAELLSRQSAISAAELDAEADALGALGSARVTFIAPDGSVLGDSQLSTDALRSVENHADRPEVRDAISNGLGVATRYSATIDTDMLYVAVALRERPTADVAVVRLALPLTDVRDELSVVRRAALVALLSGIVLALALTWITSALMARRTV